MKNLLLLALVLVIGFGAIAQKKTKKVSITYGDELKVKKRTTLSDIVARDETGFYALLRGKGDFILQKFDSKMHLQNSVFLELKYMKKDRAYEGIISVDKRLFLLSSFRNKKLKKKFLFVQTINKKTLLPNDDLKKIAEIDFGNKGKRNSGNFNAIVSSDSSKVLVYYNLPFDKGDPDRFGFQVYDTKMGLLWEKDVSLPYNDELFEIEDYQLDSNGDVYVLGAAFNEKRKEKRRGKPNYRFELLVYSNGGEFSKHEISIPDHFITDMKIEILKNKDIVCGGFYSEKGTFSVKGSYFLTLDSETKEIKQKSTKDFGIDFITQNMTDRKEKKAKKKKAKGKKVELYEYDLDEILPKDDGGAFLIAEQYYVDVVTTFYTDQNGVSHTRTTYHFYYNDIIVINISAEGEIIWTEKIPKRQHTINDNGYYSSYVRAYVGNKLFFVYNDNPKNMFYKDGDKLYYYNKSKKSVVSLVELDEDGKQTKELLLTREDSGVMVRPYASEQISGDELLLFGDKKKKNQFFKLTFK